MPGNRPTRMAPMWGARPPTATRKRRQSQGFRLVGRAACRSPLGLTIGRRSGNARREGFRGLSVMSRLQLTIATTDYDHFRDFRLGLVNAEGIDHIWLTLGHHEVFARFTFNREW